jgi:hypothetical protein
MGTELAKIQQDAAEVMERVLMVGDLSKLTAAERNNYYMRVCESLGLNPATRPFDYISLQGKLTLYARRDAADQLRKRDKVSITITAREKVDDVYVVTARATTPDERTDEAIGAVPLANLKGEALANAFMKAETKAKRRVTLSICGLGFTDESEIDSIPDARRVQVADNGEIIDVQAAPVPKAAQPAPKAEPKQQKPEQPKAEPTKAAEPASKPITEIQRRALTKLAQDAKVSREDFNRYLSEVHGAASSAELNQEQYQDMKLWLEMGGSSIPFADPAEEQQTFGDLGSPL